MITVTYPDGVKIDALLPGWTLLSHTCEPKAGSPFSYVISEKASWEPPPVMPSVESYIAALNRAEACRVKIARLGGVLSAFAKDMRETPQFALGRLPEPWPTRSEIDELLREARAAWDEMKLQWDALPADTRRHLSKPIDKIG